MHQRARTAPCGTYTPRLYAAISHQVGLAVLTHMLIQQPPRFTVPYSSRRDRRQPVLDVYKCRASAALAASQAPRARAAYVCKRVYYCDRACQKADWLRHKHICRQGGSEHMVEQPASNVIGRPSPFQLPDDVGVLLRKFALPSVAGLFPKWLRPLVVDVREGNPQCDLAQMMLQVDSGLRLTTDELRKLSGALQAGGADPNAAMLAARGLSPAATAALQRTLSEDKDPHTINVGSVGTCRPALRCAVASADQALLDVIKTHSEVPPQPNAVSMVFDRAGQAGGFTDLLFVAITGPNNVKSLRMALELGCDARSSHAGPTANTPDAWVVAPAVFLVANHGIGATPDEAEAMLRLLHQHGTDLNAVNSLGSTLLMTLMASPQPGELLSNSTPRTCGCCKQPGSLVQTRA